MNPLNRSDAEKINGKLRALGYFEGKNDGVWSGASREALRHFKQAIQIGDDDVWDGVTEARLVSAESQPMTDANQLMSSPDPSVTAEAFERAVGGYWSVDIRACPGGRGGSNALPVKISSKGADARSGTCSFGDIQGSGMDWDVRATCSAGGRSWESNIHFRRIGAGLKWSSEKGVTDYEICP